MSGDCQDDVTKCNFEEVHMQSGVRIAMRDGTHLSAVLYLPMNRATAAPAVLTLTPYIAQIHHEQGVYFARHGYPYLTVDVRGRGNSEGIFKANGNEAQDTHDVIEWLARQPYCNGKVAMWGGSYSGYVQWSAAKELSARLATIVPVASPFRGVDTPMRNNIFAVYRIQWLTLLSGRVQQDRIFADQAFWNRQFRRCFESGVSFKEYDALLGCSFPIFQEWLSHPQQDAYWDSYNPSAEHYAAFSIPVLTITGIYDSNQLGALMHHAQHLKHCSAEARARHYLVIGPWDHGGTRTPKAEFGGLKVGSAGLVDLAGLHLQWYAWTMQEGPKPQFLKNNVSYYVMGAEEWRYAVTLEDVTAYAIPYYLQSTGNPIHVFRSGTLSVDPPSGGDPDQYVYDPRDVTRAEIESLIDPADLTDQRMTFACAGRRLIYHSESFARDVEISGFFRLSVWLAIDQPDTDFAVAVYEVCMDGSAVLLATDSLRARYRKGLRAAELITSTAAMRYDFERFTFVSRRVAKGGCLRLVIGPIDSIFSQKNYNSGGVVSEESMQDARAVTVKLFHDESCPSALYVPFGKPEADDV